MPARALAAVDEFRPRWWALLTGSWLLALAGSGLAHWRAEWAERAWPDAVFMLAFSAALRCRGREPAIFLACGAVRDLWLGGRLGAGAVSYGLSGFLASGWRRRGGLPDMPGPGWWAGVFALPAMLPREAMEFAAPALWRESLVFGLTAALWTGALFPLADWWLDVPAWRPWRRR